MAAKAPGGREVEKLPTMSQGSRAGLHRGSAHADRSRQQGVRKGRSKGAPKAAAPRIPHPREVTGPWTPIPKGRRVLKKLDRGRTTGAQCVAHWHRMPRAEHGRRTVPFVTVLLEMVPRCWAVIAAMGHTRCACGAPMASWPYPTVTSAGLCTAEGETSDADERHCPTCQWLGTRTQTNAHAHPPLNSGDGHAPSTAQPTAARLVFRVFPLHLRSTAPPSL